MKAEPGKALRAVLFDLDDTLLENDMNRFVKEYFALLTPHMARLVPPEKFVPALWRGTYAMMANRDRTITNRQAFIADFFPRVGRSVEEMMPLFDDFYTNRFHELRSLTRPRTAARSVLQAALGHGCDIVIATNPIFPETAIRHRMAWAGVSDFPFRLVTTYEVMHAAKPDPFYYTEILERIGREPDESIMVGNDWGNDMEPAMKAGLRVFWINGTSVITNDLDPGARGTLEDFRDRFFPDGCGGNETWL
jgi:FMN phosphatase YigB (HAD superfamily)